MEKDVRKVLTIMNPPGSLAAELGESLGHAVKPHAVEQVMRFGDRLEKRGGMTQEEAANHIMFSDVLPHH